MNSPRQPSQVTKKRTGPRLDLFGAKALIRARKYPDSGSVGDLPPLNLAIYGGFTDQAWDYLEEQLSAFEFMSAMFHDTPCQPIELTTIKDHGQSESGAEK